MTFGKIKRGNDVLECHAVYAVINLGMLASAGLDRSLGLPNNNLANWITAYSLKQAEITQRVVQLEAGPERDRSNRPYFKQGHSVSTTQTTSSNE